MAQIEVWFDGRVRHVYDEDEFNVVKLMLEEADAATGGVKKALPVIADLVSQGYKEADARQIVILARSVLSGNQVELVITE